MRGSTIVNEARQKRRMQAKAQPKRNKQPAAPECPVCLFVCFVFFVCLFVCLYLCSLTSGTGLP